MSFDTVYIQSNAAVICVDTRTTQKVLILPNAGSVPGNEIIFKDYYGQASTHPFILSTTGVNTIEGYSNAISVGSNNGSIHLSSDGVTSWRIINSYNGSQVAPPMTFLPTDLPDLMLWFDAQDNSSITLGASNDIVQWNDKSGNSNNTTSATGCNASLLIQGAIGPYQAIQFSNGGFGGSISGGYTEYYIHSFALTSLASYDPKDHTPRLLSLGFRGDYDYVSNSYGLPIVSLTGTSDIGCARGSYCTQSITYDVPFILQTQINANNLQTAVNGDNGNTVDSGVYDSFNITDYGLGSDVYLADYIGWWTGVVGEVISYSNILSESNAKKIEGYLAWKWGRVSLLPSSHPYKYVPPS